VDDQKGTEPSINYAEFKLLEAMIPLEAVLMNLLKFIISIEPWKRHELVTPQTE
jgi:hypothetical protein